MSVVVACAALLPASNLLQAAPSSVEPVRVKLISETAQVVPGTWFNLALEFKLEPLWHIYWKNPGASGLPVEIEWDLPAGYVAGEIQWPAPERFELGGLINYGYAHAVTLIVPIKAEETVELGAVLPIKAQASWLVCKEWCLPGEASLSVELKTGDRAVPSAEASVFTTARTQLPESGTPWSVSATIEAQTLVLTIEQTGNTPIPRELYFYADHAGVIDPSATQSFHLIDDRTARLEALLAVEQSESPSTLLTGVLQSTSGNWAIEAVIGATAVVPTVPPPLDLSYRTGFEGLLLDLGLPGWLLLAFVGGLILNGMPCVLPVLSLKVFSLLQHSGQSRAQTLLHGTAYTAGVVVSFLVLAAALFALRAVGERIGWGFQLQSPYFVVVLTVVFFLFGLNLLGVFEIGGRLVGADAEVSKRKDIFGSFGMGILAAVVGAPCMGPLVASVSGIAVQTDLLSGLLIFAVMGGGLASPFVLLSIFPRLVTYLPKPGAWMESVKQFMGFLLLAAVVFLAFVAGRLGGVDAVIGLLIGLLILALAAWIYGRWSLPVKPQRTRKIARWISLILCIVAIAYALRVTNRAYHTSANNAATSTSDGAWDAWSAERVAAALSQGQPVFIDFTASWCLICQVNKKVALRTEATQALFEAYDVVPLEADWTRHDPAITAELERFGRSGVPLYVLYTPDGEVTVLPQSLSSGIVRKTLEKALK